MIEPSEKTYVQRLEHTNPIVQDHRVHGVCTLPGVVLLDMIYRLSIQQLRLEIIELKQIVFMQPVVTTEQFDQNIYVTFTPVGSDWRVSVLSRRIRGEQFIDDETSTNMQCSLQSIDYLKERYDHGIDIKQLMSSATAKWDMDEVYSLARGVKINHYPFMKTNGTVFQKGNQELMCLQLSPLAVKYIDKFHAHVAFLDGSTFAGSSFRLKGLQTGVFEDDTPYIPFMISHFRIYRPLPHTIYTYTTQQNEAIKEVSGAVPDILTRDITIMDEMGQVLVEFKGFSIKRIREPRLIKDLIELEELSPAVSNHLDVNINETLSLEKNQDMENSATPALRPHESYDAKKTILYYLQTEIAAMLNTSANQVGIYDGFYQLGLNSIQLLELVKILEQKLRRPLYPTLLFEYSTLETLSEYLMENSGDAFSYQESSEEPVDQTPKVKAGYPTAQRLLFEEIWNRQCRSSSSSSSAERRHFIIFYDRMHNLQAYLQQHTEFEQVLDLNAATPYEGEAWEDKFKRLLLIIQNELLRKSQTKLLIQLVSGNQETNKYAAALQALLKTAYIENPKIQSQHIIIDDLASCLPETIVPLLQLEAQAHDQGTIAIAYQGKQLERYVQEFIELKVPDAPYNYRKDAAYVITGGLGGIGILLAHHLTDVCEGRVKLALLGRSPLTLENEMRINALIEKGAEVIYLQTDLTSHNETEHAFKAIKQKWGAPAGIFHCAGVIHDQLIIQKTPSEVDRVLKPKLQGSHHLDIATQDEALDFFMLFSSVSAITGNLGQADYASANAYIDIFAKERQRKVKQGQRKGITLSVNWPLWSEGGMQIGDQMEEIMYASSGTLPLPTTEALRIVDSLLMAEQARAIVLYGDYEKILKNMGGLAYNSPAGELASTTGDNVISANERSSDTDDIAIIGVSGRYPMANNLDELYQNLKEGKDCISSIPESRWANNSISYDVNEFYKYGGFIEGIDEFDPLFFNITPFHAEMMDPQARLFLQTAWEACEDAGFALQRTHHDYSSSSHRSVGVFAGVMWNHYELYGSEMTQRGTPMGFGISSSSIPNMVSYSMNFHGPSIAVDTMCSSSLTAIHLACESIRRDECQYALAGGVNLVTHPHKYVFLQQAHFLSSDGKCRSFGVDGDGYVPGEGVGALLLTKLSVAEKEGYPIYGVIKGSAINHVGKTSGSTVPDPIAQSEVISDAIRKAGVDPKTITYVEAHGTGTSLGDPIEVHGLQRAFQPWTDGEKFCALGSLKSNIGHLEAAAGIAGITKLLLQFKHKEIFPSLHAEKLNPYISLDNTPFYVETGFQSWARPTIEIAGQKTTVPLRAGISSFGANGSNAHLIVEEYEKKIVFENERQKEITSVLIPLSGKNEDRLQVYAKKILDFLQNQLVALDDKNIKEADAAKELLMNMAFTLQTGREAMEHRVIFEVSTIAELMHQLDMFLNKLTDIPNCYQGKAVGQHFDRQILDEDRKIYAKWIQERKLREVSKRWVKGAVIDWSLLYGNMHPRRMSLPTYPFARERYWVPQPAEPRVLPTGVNLAGAPARAVLHPLLQENTSDLAGQRYSSTFWGTEPFLRDHVVQGAAVLPGVAYLEMARAAVESARGTQEQPGVLQLSRIVWSRPLQVEGDAVQVDIGLAVEEDGRICYDIYQETGVSGETVVYSQGQARWLEANEVAWVDLAARQASCTQGVMEGAACYAQFAKLGLQYGATHQGLVRLHLGEGEVLAHVRLPEEARASQALYTLHPALMDAVLQGCLGLQLEAGQGAPEPELPFALEALEVRQACPEEGWAWIRYSAGSGPEARVRKLDIEVCDLQGQVCVRLSGFSTRPLHGEKAQLGTVMAEPVWHAQEVPAAHAQQETEEVHLVLLCDPPESASPVAWAELLDLLQTSPQVVCHRLQAEAQRLEQRYEQYAMQALERIQEVLRSKPQQRVLIQIVSVDSEAEEAGYAALWSGLTGLLRTAQLEQPKLRGQMIELGRLFTGQEGLQRLQDNRRCLQETDIRYRAGTREVARWQVCPEPASLETLPWKDGGVYVVTGGAGGLGQRVAQDIAAKTKHPILILAGRSPESAAAEPLAQLRAQGAEAIYAQLDVTDGPAVHALMKQIQQKYGALNGVIHSAGVIEDQYLLKKNVAEGKRVLAPKVAGTVHLDEATRGMKLDLFLLFSSIAGVLGNAGQADYAMANAFMDRYAVYRQEQVKQGIGHGRTLSLNWPLWAEGGMQVDLATRQRMEQQLGMTPLRTTTGITLLYQALAGTSARIMAAEGQVHRLKELILGHGHVVSDNLNTMELDLTQMVAKVLKVEPDYVDIDVDLIDYGFDQVLFAELMGTMNKHFQLDVSTNIFQEYTTILRLSAYLKSIFIEPTQNQHTINPASDPHIFNKTVDYLRKMLSSVIKLPVHRIDADKELEYYGIDSVMIVTMTDNLERVLGPLSKTLFFEYQTLNELAAYFSQNHVDQLIKLFDVSVVTSLPTPQPTSLIKEPVQSIRAKRSASHHEQIAKTPDIAIIGLSGKYPGADNLQQYWNNLKDGKDCITEIPPERWDYRAYFDADSSKVGKVYSRWGGFLNGVDQFDPKFFHISPHDAQFLDPQERLFLQCAYEVIEDSGYTKDTLVVKDEENPTASVGVFVGIMYEEYQLYGAQSQVLGQQIAFGGHPATIANRVSYYCNFHGPSMAVDTMCSSSSTAIHLACQSLRSNECEVAIAGGVNVSIHPNKYLKLSQGNFLSTTGRCESFGEGGDGYVPGEGVGAVLLKPLNKAIVDGDHIYGVLKGTAVNHGGKTNGYTVPNPNAQAAVIKRAIRESEIHPQALSYIEAHGTGTSLGDPIEIAGLTKVFKDYGTDRHCSIGSVKSNIGHCESASGIAGLTKILLQMQHKKLAPSLHSQTLNPNINFDNTPFIVQQELTPWHRPKLHINGELIEHPRTAGISSFGAGGANAHIIVEEYIPQKKVPSKNASIFVPENGEVIIVLSALNEEKLVERAKQLINVIQDSKYSDTHLNAMAYTLQTGREAMVERLAVIVTSMQELKEKLTVFINNQISDGLYRGHTKNQHEILRLFTEDDELDNIVDKWMARKKYTKLVDLWTMGMNINWTKLYKDGHPQRMSLPTYPFSKERYWITPPEVASRAFKQSKDGGHPLLKHYLNLSSDHTHMLADNLSNKNCWNYASERVKSI
ncbi:KR domain-containing protein [Paenibacillus polymyxa]|nr:SDR family NAD(P)-dependent oxidoreductase [Paenibacillus polymyxa]APB70029.1 KR domain-containing protein [Paenibacillus polymyxa]